MDKGEWTALGWTVGEDGSGGFSIGRDSEAACNRCGRPGPWTLRGLPNGELAHRDYAVCRCGEMRHAEAVWPGAPRPGHLR